MPQLIIVRHAKSGYPPGVADFDRPLAQRGLREAPLMRPIIAKWLETETCIDAWISQAQRTRHTWQLIASAMGQEERVAASITEHHERGLYEASAREIAEVISRTGEGCAAVVVGHNPGVQQVICDYAADGAVRDQVAMRFPTSTLIRLEWEGDWSEFPRGRLTAMEMIIARPVANEG
ncbi:MAG: hypothetical protein RJB01_978 [Actinomycetota bacterium]|jgi:phosphohistidine phosphatase